MRKSIVIAVLFAAFSLVGCASDVGERGSLLVRVNEREMTNQVLYYAPEVSAIPLTATDAAVLGVDITTATPVRVEILDNVAAAWHAPEGEALIARDEIMALWRVVERTPIDGELNPGEVPTVEQPTAPAEEPYASFDIPSATLPGLVESSQIPVTEVVAGSAIIDFINSLGWEEQIEMFEELQDSHPGCL